MVFVLIGAGLAGLAVGRLAAAVATRYRYGPTRFPAAELTTAALFAAVTARFGLGWQAVPPLVAASALVTLSAVDLRSYRLPDAVLWPAFGLSAAVVAAASLATGRPGAAAAALAAAAGYGALLLVVHEISPQGLGFGDVKLALLLGLHLGWAAAARGGGWAAVVGLVAQSLMISGAVGLAMGLAVAVLRRRGHDVLPDPSARSEPAQPADPAAPADLADPAGPAETVAPADPAVLARPGLLATAFPFGPALASGTMAAILIADFLPR